MGELKGNSKKDKQDELIKILGFDYETFKNTANFEQGDSSSFSKLTPKEAKLTVMKILQLTQFEVLEKKCRDKYKILFDKGSELKIKIEYMEENIDWKEIEISPYEERIKILERELVQSKREIELIESQKEISFQINQLKGVIEKFNSLNTCPTCRQIVGENHKEEILKEQKESLESLKKSIDYNLINKATLARDTYSMLLTELAEKRNTIKIINERKEKLKQLLTDKNSYIHELEEIRTQLTVYKNLIEAFGKNGIPSYIISNTIPEIENTANSLLDTLGINFQISIATEKMTKEGNLAGTLDINISSGKFKRPYYMFSGGEKFLIDLSLRVALSIILLRRKGCNNSTLIIDEGFGSLDGVNGVKVVELINLVQKRYGFKKILLVTHVINVQDTLQRKIEAIKKDIPEEHSILSYNINEGE